jgi:hypothetical protein
VRIYLDCLAAAAACTVAWTVCPARLRHWLRGRYRLAWYRLTRRMPRCKVRPEPEDGLSAAEFMAFRRLADSARKGSAAPEPGYGRRRQP